MVNLEIQFFGFIVSHRFQNKRFVALWLCGFAANLKLMLIVTCGFRNYLATRKRDNAS